MTDKEQKAAAKAFKERWSGTGYEKGESQKFWIDLLTSVLGIKPDEIKSFIEFENQVLLSHMSFIDGYIPSTAVMIEQKSLGKDLRKGIKQSDGSVLSPFQQAKRYVSELPRSMHPKWIITCNFEEFLVYDMEKPNGEPEQIFLKDLERDYYRLKFLTETGNTHIQREKEISLKAGKAVGKIYDALFVQYKDPTNPDTLRSLNMLCVRFVFCLYAEDAGIFERLQFGHYLSQYQSKDVRRALIDLFKILDTPLDKRDPYLDDDLAAFPYVNGGLFADDNIEIPRFSDDIVHLIVDEVSAGIDWSEISPTIFGAVFESTLNPDTRRSGGMHYTSIENIHKLIDPLFLDGLKAELDNILAMKVPKTRKDRLVEFTDKLSSTVYFDPACGSGNFLTESYTSLRKLENKAISALYGEGQMYLEGLSPIKVSISQFYGIEINDFAVAVARTAMWIAESQMLQKTESILGKDLSFLPLKNNANIIEGNALRMDWKSLLPEGIPVCIEGNPPFVGARIMNDKQKSDVMNIFDGVKNNGNLDYVSCWYKKAAELMTGNSTRAALVSTNSITQGEQVAILWKELFRHGVHIDFAHRTFRWDNRGTDESGKKQKSDEYMAAVHCVIVGFSKAPNDQPKRIFDNGTEKIVKNINGYLVDADDVVIDSRQHPICKVPEIGIGNKPIDDGNYLFTKEEMDEFIRVEPKSAQYFRPWLGSKEFINGYQRYCLWLGDCSPKELRSMPKCLERIENVKKFRLASKSAGTRKLAEKPARFHVENMPDSTYILVPKVSSENRRYIPMGFISPETLCSDLVFIIPNADIYHFGILTSNVHMAWMRTVCGRLKSDYRYSKDIVYNNFPWCDPTPEQKAKIEKTAQAILDARAKYPDSSLADLYDETTMPPELRKAHQLNDKAVMEAYGFDVHMTESECVAELMKMYKTLTKDIM